MSDIKRISKFEFKVNVNGFEGVMFGGNKCTYIEEPIWYGVEDKKINAKLAYAIFEFKDIIEISNKYLLPLDMTVFKDVAEYLKIYYEITELTTKEKAEAFFGNHEKYSANLFANTEEDAIPRGNNDEPNIGLSKGYLYDYLALSSKDETFLKMSYIENYTILEDFKSGKINSRIFELLRRFYSELRWGIKTNKPVNIDRYKEIVPILKGKYKEYTLAKNIEDVDKLLLGQ